MDSMVLEDFSNLKLCDSKISTGDVHSLPSPFCLTVTTTGWILPKSSQKEQQVLSLSATSAPQAQEPSQGQDVRAPGLWDAATSVSSMGTGNKECANSRFHPLLQNTSPGDRSALHRAELWWGISDVLLKAEFASAAMSSPSSLPGIFQEHMGM